MSMGESEFRVAKVFSQVKTGHSTNWVVAAFQNHRQLMKRERDRLLVGDVSVIDRLCASGLQDLSVS